MLSENEESFVTHGKKMAVKFTTPVEAPGVGAEKPFQAGDQIGFGS
jgi:hypothetical protein